MAVEQAEVSFTETLEDFRQDVLTTNVDINTRLQ